MFDNRLVFESPGRLPGMVKPSNIRYTHFSRNPKIAQFLKVYNYVKEFGEGVDRIYRELEANGTPHLLLHLDDFILKITIPKVTCNETSQKNATANAENATATHEELIQKLIKKAIIRGDKLTANRLSILRIMIENPYTKKDEMAEIIGVNASTIMRNIEFMRNKYLRRVGSDKNGFWEIIE